MILDIALTISKSVYVESIRFAIFLLLTWNLSVSQYGELNIYLAIIFLAGNFVTIGLTNAAIYYLNQGDGYFLTICRLHLFVKNIFFVIISFIFFIFSLEFYSYISLNIAAFSSFLIAISLLSAKHLFKARNIVESIQATVMLIMLFFSVENITVSSFFVINLTSYGLAAVLAFYLLNTRKMLMSQILQTNDRKSPWKKYYLYGLRSLAASMTSYLNNRIDLFVIQWFFGDVATGLYAFASQFSERFGIISVSVANILFPKLTAASSVHRQNLMKRGVIISFLLTSMMVILFFSVGLENLMVWLDWEQFIDSVWIVEILWIGVIILSVSRLLASFLNSINEVDVVCKITFIGASINALMNPFGATFFGIMAIPYVTIFIHTICLLIYIKNVKNRLD